MEAAAEWGACAGDGGAVKVQDGDVAVAEGGICAAHGTLRRTDGGEEKEQARELGGAKTHHGSILDEEVARKVVKIIGALVGSASFPPRLTPVLLL
jgi:hypothetical protein